MVKGFESINTSIFIIDGLNKLDINPNNLIKKYTTNFDEIVEGINNSINKLITSNQLVNLVIIVYGLDKFVTKLQDKNKFNDLLNNLKKYEHIPIIIVDDAAKIKKYAFESWYTGTFTNQEGIWIGKGIVDQSVFRLAIVNKEMQADIKNDMGYYLEDGYVNLFKVIDFSQEGDNNE